MEENNTIEQQEETVQKDELKSAIEKTMDNIRTQSMLLGAQAMCQTILGKIYAFESSNGKKSANDYKRCIKDVKKFCEVGLSRKVNADGTTEEIEQEEPETVQN